jgi:hypothetical protein
VVKAGLVADQVGVILGGGECDVSGGELVVGRILAGVVDFAVDHVAFPGVEAADAPLGDDHVLDEAEFDFVGGLETVDEGIEEVEEIFFVLELGDYVFGEDAVFDGILRGALFALGGDRPFGFCPVGTGSSDATFGTHSSFRKRS